MKIVDLVFGWLLVVGSLMHGAGSYAAFKHEPMSLLWAWSASLAGLLLAGINLIRAGHPELRSLAWLSIFACVWWMAQALAFGKLIGHVFDPRAIIHFVNALALAGFSLRTALAPGAK